MKLNIHFSCALIFLFFTIACDRQRISETGPDKEKGLSSIDLTQVNENPVEFGLSALIDKEFEIIPLETRPDNLIGNISGVLFTKNFFLLDNSIHSSKPGKIYRFDYSGKFINEISRGGKGPGEHIGNFAALRYSEKNNQIQAIWRGTYGFENPQFFSLEGEFLGQLRTPFRGLTNIERWSDSTWFSVGLGETGAHTQPSDSLRLIFFSADGTVLKSFPRRGYPVNLISSSVGLPIFTAGRSAYATEGRWKFVLEGVDTLFRIDSLKMIPDAVFRQPVTENPPMMHILAETSGNLIFRRTIESNIRFEEHEGSPVSSSDKVKMLQSDKKEEFIILDKTTGIARNVKLIDNVFHVFPDLTNPFQLAPNLRWTSDGRIYLIVPAVDFIRIRNKIKSEDVASSVLEKLKTFDKVSENDNPVIFLFSLMDHVAIE